MDQSYKFPGSPGTPLFPVSPERVNQQRPQSMYDELPSASTHLFRESHQHSRESSVHERVAALNSLAFQGKQLERKTNDAALKRAMLGREEAESEMRRYREEVRSLRRQVEEGRDRERKVGARLEDYMEKYVRAKETHTHTQTLWEKEIRRARKEAFKSQSVFVRLQEELKGSRSSLKILQADLEQEKGRSEKREQEAFAARYQLVGAQQELSEMQERIKLVEQERDALRTIAKNEEVARIAAEGRIPLPVSSEDDEFASPKKVRRSMDQLNITSSAASEEELDDMRMLLQWERQRASRAQDRVDFLELECMLNCCSAKDSRSNKLEVPEAVRASAATQANTEAGPIFIPAEGVFRTVSPPPEESPWNSPAKKIVDHPTLDLVTHKSTEPIQEAHSFARTPSCEPPAPALVADVNTSLLSLLDAPHGSSPSHSENGDEIESYDCNSNVVETFHTISTTTRIPLANPPDLTPQATIPTDAKDALSPTMTREEALAQIKERRGRARSMAQGTATPKKQMITGVVRRDISAPAIRSGNMRGRSQVRT